MAGGNDEIVGIPCVYRVRHIEGRRKALSTAYLYEEKVTRVPGWSADEAPLVAHADVPCPVAGHGGDQPPRVERVQYRAARCSDGVVRLVAPVDSAAMCWQPQPGQPADNSLATYVRAPLFQPPNRVSTQLNIAEHLKPAHRLGNTTILNSERAGGLEHTAGLLARLVSVDGRLHAACHEPGWIFLPRNRRVGEQWARVVEQVHVSPDPMDCLRTDYGGFMPYNREPANTLAALNPDVAAEHVGAPSGGITQLVAGALGGDWQWRMLRLSAYMAVHNDEKLVCRLWDDELALRIRLTSALANWPVERNAALAADTIRFVQTVYGLKSSGNSEMLECAQARTAYLRDNPSPMPLEARLEIAGLELPPLPGGPAPTGPG